MELLRLDDVSKIIKKKDIIKSVSLHVNSGEIVGFVGPNGAGKTTTIKMIMGLFSITSGSIHISGFDITKDFEKAMRNVGAIIENPDLYMRLSGRKNLEYLASLHSDEAVKNIDAVVNLVKMSARINDRLSTYSLGMRQRIGLAQALLHMPSLLILDEPTNGLDPIGIKELRDTIRSLSKDSGLGVFISSHLLSEIEVICDRVYVINNGVIIEERNLNQKSTDEEIEYEFVLNEYSSAIAYFAENGIVATEGDESITAFVQKQAMPPIIKALVELGVEIFEVTAKHRSLESDFISLLSTNEQIS